MTGFYDKSESLTSYSLSRKRCRVGMTKNGVFRLFTKPSSPCRGDIYDAHHCGFDKLACQMAGRSNPYRSAPKVRYIKQIYVEDREVSRLLRQIKNPEHDAPGPFIIKTKICFLLEVNLPFQPKIGVFTLCVTTMIGLKILYTKLGNDEKD